MISFVWHFERLVKQGPTQGTFTLTKLHFTSLALYPPSAPQPCLTLCNPMDCSPPGSSAHGDPPGKNTGVGCHALLQGICTTQGSNSSLPCCRRILYHLSHQISPMSLENSPDFSLEEVKELKLGPRASCLKRPLVAGRVATIFIYHINAKSFWPVFSLLLLGFCSSLIYALCCLLCMRHFLLHPGLTDSWPISFLCDWS